MKIDMSRILHNILGVGAQFTTPILTLFYDDLSSLDDIDLEYCVRQAVEGETIVNVIKVMLYRLDVEHARDRGSFFRIFIALHELGYTNELREILSSIPWSGNWKDLVHLYHLIPNTSFRNEILNLFEGTLHEDERYMLIGEYDKMTMCAKWIPREGSRLEKITHFQKDLADFMFMTRGQVRKLVSKLCNALAIVERLICEKRYEDIQYDKLSRNQLKRHSHLFKKYDGVRYSRFTLAKQLCANASETCYLGDYISYYDRNKMFHDTLEQDFNDVVTNVTYNKNAVVIADTTHYNALAHALILSQNLGGSFRNSVCTWGNTQRVIHLATKWDLCTNIRKTLRQYATDKKLNLDQFFGCLLETMEARGEDMLDEIVILGNKPLNDSVIMPTKALENYFSTETTIPNIVYWNLDNNEQVHVNRFTACGGFVNVTEIVGHSVGITQTLLSHKEITQENVMRDILEVAIDLL